MQNYVVELESEPFHSFRCDKAAQSLDIDLSKKLKHTLNISADLSTPYNIGLIVGASGSGKTTLAKKIFGENCFKEFLDPSLPVIEQFPKEFLYEDCASALNSIGLSQVTCWLRPAATLSNGQKARAEAALAMSIQDDVVIDEWTSVVDRTVAKAMSFCINKHSRKFNRKVVLLACHYDIIDWLNPDWIIDCNKKEYIERRSMVGAFERTDRLRFEIRECSRKTWPMFSKYHYLSDKLPGGKIFLFGLFHGKDQVGFQCFANYVMGKQKILHSNRIVIHPDYVGFGLGIKFVNESSAIMKERGFRILIKFSSIPILKSLQKDKKWKLLSINKDLKGPGRGQFEKNNKTFRKKVKSYTYEFLG